MDRDKLIDYLSAMTDAEFSALAAEARANPEPSPADQVRAAEAAGDWRTAFALKARQLNSLMNPPAPTPKD